MIVIIIYFRGFFMKRVLFYLIAIIVLLFSSYLYQELNYQKNIPITIPIVFADGKTISKTFKVDHRNRYAIYLKFKGNVIDDEGNILFSSRSYGAKMPKNGKGLLELKWILYQENEVIVEKQSKEDLFGYGGNENSCYTTLGEFDGIKEDEYLLEITLLNSHPNVGMMNPTVTIEKHYTAIEGSMWVSFFCLVLGLVSASIIVYMTIRDMFNLRGQA